MPAAKLKIDEEELLSRIEAEHAAAQGRLSGDGTADERARNIDYYLGEPSDIPRPGVGRSRYVSQDVSDVIDGLMPGLMEILLGEPPVSLLPLGDGDANKAAEETEACYHALFTLNPGFLALYDALKQGLLEKNGYVKVRTIHRTETQEERIDGVLREVAEGLPVEDGVEIAITERDDGMVDVVATRETTKSAVLIDAVSPEDITISAGCRSDISRATYLSQAVRLTQSELIEMGVDAALVDTLETASTNVGSKPERAARYQNRGDTSLTAEHNRANREIEVLEHFICTDVDGDGKTEKLVVHTTSSVGQILLIQEVEDHDYASWTPIRVPQRHHGIAVADRTIPYMRAKTGAERIMQDNFALSTHPRPIIGDDITNEHTLDDYLMIRPGAPIRTARSAPIPVYQPMPIAQHVAPVIEHYDRKQEFTTGYSRTGVSVDKNAFNSTATGAAMLNSAQQATQKLYARMFVEQLMTRLLMLLHRHLRASGTTELSFQIGDRWVAPKPKDWPAREYVRVNVNLGATTREQNVAFMNAAVGLTSQLIQLQQGTKGPFVYPSNVYNLVRAFYEAGGKKAFSSFIEDPANPPTPERLAQLGVPPQTGQQPQPPVELMIAQMQAQVLQQIEEMKARSKAETELMVAQIKADSQMQVKQMEAAFDAKLDAWKAGLEHSARLHEIERRPDPVRPGQFVPPLVIR